MKKLRFVLGLFSMVAMSVLAGPDIGTCFSPETLAVVRLDMQQLRMMPLIMQVLEAKTKGYDLLVSNVQEWTGLDLDAASVGWLGVAENDRVVIVLEGNFDSRAMQDKIPMIDKAQIVHLENVLLAFLLADDKKPGKSNLAVLVNENRVVFGNPELADTFLAAYAGHDVGLAAEKAAFVKSMLPAKSAVQVALLRLPAKEMAKNPWMKLITGGILYADMEDTLQIEVSVFAQKTEMLAPVKDILEGLRDVYKLLDEEHQKLDHKVELLLENLQVEVDKKSLMLSVEIDAAEVERFIQQKLGQ